MRILEGPAAVRYVRKLETRGQKLDALEPKVRRIVQECQAGRRPRTPSIRRALGRAASGDIVAG